MKRKTDTQSKAHFRTDRLFQEGGQWYFKIRGGDVMGPFEDEVRAINQLEIYIRMADSGLLPAAASDLATEKRTADSVR